MVDQKVSAGLSTVSLGGVSVVAYVAAVVAFFNGARDEATIGTAAIGTVALVTLAAGRFWQAVAKAKAAPTLLVAQDDVNRRRAARLEAGVRGKAFTSPRPGAEVGAGVFSSGIGEVTKRDVEEPGDPDALPDYQTDDVIPDDGDDQAVKP